MDNQMHTHSTVRGKRSCRGLLSRDLCWKSNMKELYDEGSVQPPRHVTEVEGSHWGRRRSLTTNPYALTCAHKHRTHINVHTRPHTRFICTHSRRAHTCTCHRSSCAAVLWRLWGLGTRSRKPGVHAPSLTLCWTLTALKDRMTEYKGAGHKVKSWVENIQLQKSCKTEY